MKKVLSFLIVTALLILFALPTFAATDVNPNEQAVLARFGAGCVVSDHTLTPSIDNQNMARNFFMMDGVDFTLSDANLIITAIDDICDVIKDYPSITQTSTLRVQLFSSLADLPLVAKQKILKLAQDAASNVDSIDISFEYDFASKEASILSGDSEVMVTSEISLTSVIVKNTGYDGDATLWMIAILSLTMVTGVVLAKKKHLLARKP